MADSQDSFDKTIHEDPSGKPSQRASKDLSRDHVSTWAEIGDSKTNLDATDAIGAIGEDSIQELMAIYDCFDLLERVWPSDYSQPQTAGPFELERMIAQGGMGTVWLAHQHEPIQRKLAVKLINPGPTSEQVIERFKSERNVLALMNHPNIAGIIDAGTTDEGQLYFAMELIDGPDLVTHCDLNRLPVEQRLQLFLDACNAVQHAHQKGVIHRDLKPSNILVGEVDGQPFVKVIDFGLAKAIQGDELFHEEAQFFEKNLGPMLDGNQTRFGQILGSIWYMSPEQASKTSQEIDTRTDVYALGVVLYQLLTGALPLDKGSLSEAPIEEILNEIRSTVALLPSERIEGEPELERNTLLAYRHTNESEYRKQLTEDLDWIVMKAIEKDKAKRYASVSELASDLQRFLAGEPVLARPASTRYALSKSFRKHRLAYLSVGAIVAAIFVGIGLSTWGLIRATKAEKLAQDRLIQTQRSGHILSSIFEDLDLKSIDQSRKPFKMLMADRLVSAANQIDSESLGDPLEVAEIQIKLGRSLISLGFPNEAIPVCKDAYEVTNSLLGMELLTREAGLELTWAYLRAGEYDEAENVLMPILEFLDQNETFADAEERMDFENTLGRLSYARGNNEKAIASFERLLEGRESLYGRSDVRTMGAVSSLASTYTSAKDYKRAIPMMEEVVETLQTELPAGHPKTINAIINLAWAYGQSPDRIKAVPLAEQAYELARRTYGEEHTETYSALLQMGVTAYSLGKYEEARDKLERAVAGLKNSSGLDHPRTAMANQILARLFKSTGEPGKAIPLMEKNLELMIAKNSAYPPAIRDRVVELAMTYNETGDFAKARNLLATCKEQISAENDGIPTKEAFVMANQIGNTYFDEGRYKDSLASFEEAYQGLSEVADKFDFEMMLAVVDLGKSLSQDGQHERAISLLREYLDDVTAKVGAQSRLTLIVTAQLGIVLSHAGNVEEGIEMMESVANSGVRLKKMDYLMKELRRAYLESGALEKFAASVEREQNFFSRRFDPNSKPYADRLLVLGHDLLEFKQYDQAKKNVLQRSLKILVAEAPQSWSRWMAQLQLGQAKIGLGELNEGSDDMDEAFGKLESQLGNALPKDQSQLNDVIERTVLLLDSLYLDQEANHWRERLAK